MRPRANHNGTGRVRTSVAKAYIQVELVPTADQLHRACIDCTDGNKSKTQLGCPHKLNTGTNRRQLYSPRAVGKKTKGAGEPRVHSRKSHNWTALVSGDSCSDCVPMSEEGGGGERWGRRMYGRSSRASSELPMHRGWAQRSRCKKAPKGACVAYQRQTAHGRETLEAAVRTRHWLHSAPAPVPVGS